MVVPPRGAFGWKKGQERNRRRNGGALRDKCESSKVMFLYEKFILKLLFSMPINN